MTGVLLLMHSISVEMHVSVQGCTKKVKRVVNPVTAMKAQGGVEVYLHPFYKLGATPAIITLDIRCVTSIPRRFYTGATYGEPLRTVRPIYRTGVPLSSKCCFYIFFSITISTEYFKHAAHSPFFSSKCRLFHNVNFFGSCIIHILHTECAKM
jgi:hypothetical protein